MSRAVESRQHSVFTKENAVVLVNPLRADPWRIPKKVHPPKNLLYLGAALGQRGHSVKVIDANAWDMTIPRTVEVLTRLEPALVGFPLFSDILHPTAQLIRATRDALPHTPIVLGGLHATAWPERTMNDIPEADYLLAGYAEETLCQLVEVLRDGIAPETVPDCYFRRNGRIETGGGHIEPSNIDALPFPDRSLVADAFEANRYYQLFNTRPFDSIVTGRGCPRSCHFCYNSARRGFYYRSAENIYEEITSLYELGVRYLDVDDDHFTIPRSVAHKVFDLMIRDGLDLELFIKSRTDGVDRDLLRHASEAGVRLISYGLESGDPTLLEAMNKGATVEDAERAVILAHEAGIRVHGGFFIGYPGETPETIGRSIQLARRLPLDAVSLEILKPYPGTKVYEDAERDGTLKGDWNTDRPELPWVRLPWTQTREDLVTWQGRFLRAFYFRPHVVLSMGRRIAANADLRLARFATRAVFEALKGIDRF